MKKLKKTGNLEKDFPCISLLATADSAIQDCANNIDAKYHESFYALRNSFCVRLERMFTDCYYAQCHSKLGGIFSKITNATEMRDTIFEFNRHWLASILQKEFKSIYYSLPKDYGWSR